jgi:hypothetical protein
MQRIGVLALCATLAASTLLPVAASAEDAGAAPAARAATTKPTTKARRRKPAATAQAAAPTADSYQLVPSKAGSALSRARQNSFGTPDEDPAPSGGSRRIGVGLGGANGTSPGMAIGF